MKALKITADNLQNIISRDPKADPSINYNIIDESITKAIKMFSKSKTAKLNRRKHKLSKWITKGIIRSINTRNDMYRKLRKTSPDSEDFQKKTTNLKTFSTILKRSIHTAKKHYYNSFFDKYKNNNKQTWSTINNILNKNNKKHKLPYLFNINGTLTNNKKDIVNSFNRYFCNIGPKSPLILTNPTTII